MPLDHQPQRKSVSNIFIDQDDWYYEEYRLEGDSPDLVRVRQRGPLCSGSEIEKDVSVAGISREPYSSNAHRFCGGTYRWLDLERKRLDGYPHAIAVFGRWWEAGSEQRGQIGWVPDRIAKRIHKEIPAATLRARLFLIFLPINNRSPGLRFDLLHAKRQDSGR